MDESKTQMERTARGWGEGLRGQEIEDYDRRRQGKDIIYEELQSHVETRGKEQTGIGKTHEGKKDERENGEMKEEEKCDVWCVGRADDRKKGF